MSNIRRVLWVHTDAAWEVGLARALSQEPDLQVQSITPMSKPTILSEVTRFQPDVIVLNEDGPLHPDPLRQWLAGIPALTPVRIIVLNNQNMVIDVYDPFKTWQVMVTDLTALGQFLRDMPPD